jgi:hypothetical protein
MSPVLGAKHVPRLDSWDAAFNIAQVPLRNSLESGPIRAVST